MSSSLAGSGVGVWFWSPEGVVEPGVGEGVAPVGEGAGVVVMAVVTVTGVAVSGTNLRLVVTAGEMDGVG